MISSLFGSITLTSVSFFNAQCAGEIGIHQRPKISLHEILWLFFEIVYSRDLSKTPKLHLARDGGATRSALETKISGMVKKWGI